MLLHAQFHKDPLPQKTEAMGRLNYEQSPYERLTQLSWSQIPKTVPGLSLKNYQFLCQNPLQPYLYFQLK